MPDRFDTYAVVGETKGNRKLLAPGGPGRTSAGRRSKGRLGSMLRHEASPALKSFDGRGGSRTAVDRTAKKRQQGVTYDLQDAKKNSPTHCCYSV